MLGNGTRGICHGKLKLCYFLILFEVDKILFYRIVLQFLQFHLEDHRSGHFRFSRCFLHFMISGLIFIKNLFLLFCFISRISYYLSKIIYNNYIKKLVLVSWTDSSYIKNYQIDCQELIVLWSVIAGLLSGTDSLSLRKCQFYDQELTVYWKN